MTAPEQLHVEANGMAFAALAWGDPDAPLALLVHGYPDTAWTWRHLGPHLAERGWRAVAPFTRGYGPSDLAPDDSYLATDLARDVLGLHRALGGDERAVLIGHDWGAVATYAVTAVEPGRFRRYVTIAVPPTAAVLKPFTRLRTLGIGARQLRLSWYFLYNQLPGSERGLDAVIGKHWRDWSPGYDATEDVAHVLAALDTPARRTAALGYYRQNLKGGAVEGFRTRPGAPVLYLHGEDDGCVRADVAAAAALPAGSRFELVRGAGHFLQLEQPERVVELVEEWLAETE
ncbi:MAG: alpha/beta hydrolase [Frankiales bacterium]|nr:alpha/beta hydrolase [Frankiales bacterium]